MEKRVILDFFSQSMVEEKRGYMIVVTTADMEVEFGGVGQW